MTTHWTELSAKAHTMAFRVHKGQKRRDGITPYTTHIQAVVDRAGPETR
jgi:(p)ppGpp synthase/HD superfamily hydrolase